MSFDGTILIDTKIDTSSIKSSISKLEKSLKSCVKELGKVSLALKEIQNNTKGIKPALEQNIDTPLSKTITSIKTFTDTFNSISKFISTIVGIAKAFSNVSDASKAAGTSQKNMLDTSISGLTTIQGLLNLFSGKLGEATTKTTMLSAAQKALKAIAPFSKTISIISVMITLMQFLHNATDYETTKARQLKEVNEALGKTYGEIGEAAAKYYEGIETADSILNNFNSSLIVSTEKQQNLATQMDNVQNQITEIARNATEQRRGFTQSEIQRLDELLTTMNGLTEQEIAVQSSYQQAIQTQAQAAASSQSMTLEQYQVYSQSLIKSADDTKNQLIAKAEEQCTEEIALAASLRGKKAEYDEEWYNAQVEAAMTKRQELTDQANLENAETLNIIQKGYVEKSSSLKGFVSEISELNRSRVEEQKAYEEKIANIEAEYKAEFEKENSDKVQAILDYKAAMRDANTEHYEFTRENQKQITEAIKTGNAEQIGAWLEMVAETELHGGELDEKTKSTIDTLINNFDSLPQESKDIMSNVLSPMLKTMQENEPLLFAQADSIAGGIISRFKTIFNIKSPSKVMKSIFEYVMLGAEKGMDKETPNLLKQTDQMAEDVIDTAKKTLGIHSPSTVMRDEIGEQIDRGIAQGIKENSDVVLDEFNRLLDALKRKRELDIINEDEYYTELEKLRDTYFAKGSEEWLEYTTEIYNYQQDLLEKQKDAIVETFEAMLDEADDAISELEKKQEDFEKKLKQNDALFITHTMEDEDGNELAKVGELRDYSNEIDKINEYKEALSKAEARLGNSAEGKAIYEGLLDMDREEAMLFAETIINASDKEIEEYLKSYKEYQDAVKDISRDEFADEWAQLDATYGNINERMKQTVKDTFGELAEEFFVNGELSAEKFGEGFLSRMNQTQATIKSNLAGAQPVGEETSFAPKAEGMDAAIEYSEGIKEQATSDETQANIQSAGEAAGDALAKGINTSLAGNTIKTELEKTFGALPDDFFELGKEASEKFCNGFAANLLNAFATARRAFLDVVNSFTPALGVAGGGMISSASNTYNNSYNFYGSGQTVSQQLRQARADASLQKLRNI